MYRYYITNGKIAFPTLLTSKNKWQDFNTDNYSYLFKDDEYLYFTDGRGEIFNESIINYDLYEDGAKFIVILKNKEDKEAISNHIKTSYDCLGIKFIDIKNSIKNNLLLTADVVKYISNLINVELVHTPDQNDRIADGTKKLGRLFFKGFTLCDSVSLPLLQDGFEPYSDDNDCYSSEYYKKIGYFYITVTYIEGDVYLNIFLDKQCFNDYKLY